MSAIRERSILCIIDLPKKLTSSRNLRAHFSKFGEVKNVSVNKELKTGMIQFSSHFDAQSAKTQGKIYEEESLNIFWSESTSLDPRARVKHDYAVTETESLWQDDDKESFGVESVQLGTRDERKQSAKDMIRQHLSPGLKKRLGVGIKRSELISVDISKTSPIKLGKVGTKSVVSLKKNFLNQGNKRKLVRKEDTIPSVCSKPTKSTHQDENVKVTASSMFEQTDFKHKLTLLDERDKLIRKETIRDSNIKTAVAIKGTCPDMCPERERVLRQCGHAVAAYEMLPGTFEMDENKAVKEYIRSSADQEVPLPHDLRPEPVLSMTMSYLITNIISRVDNPDENKAVWYSFCWNRLRSVRKDIILQQLCDMETVKIVEQCARFHISCYDHMWGAEVSGFDDKINTQNVIDCLQTLRHMYEDLLKHNVTCPNEAEFYSYLILLKLKSGDVMWEYQQYSLKIQLSPHIQFAIEAYMAFKNNMYSRYFNLVKKASYLKACLMQRYFDEVRTQALKTMSKAYCLPGKTVGLSSSFIVSSLKFDSQKNALRFCEREEVDVKIDYDGNDQDVYLSTSSFLIREKRLPIANAVVGDNNPLPVYVPHQVNTSFDEYGKLKNVLSVISGEVEPYLSPFFEGETSQTMVPQNDSQLPTFKFSVSPTKVPENIFGKTLFPNQATLGQLIPRNEDLIKSEVSYSSVESNDNSEVLFGSIAKYDVSNTDSFEMEENFDDVMAFEDIEVEEELVPTGGHQFLTSQTEVSRTSKLEWQNPFLITSATKPSSFLQDEDSKVPNNNISISFQNEQALEVKDEAKENFTFSFSTKKEMIKPFSEDPDDNMNETNNILKCINNHDNRFKFEIPRQDTVDHKDQKQIGSAQNSLHSQNELKQTDTNKLYPEKLDYSRKQNVENLNNDNLLKTLLREKAEQEKLKMEEIARVELEKLKKKVEEQKVIQHLKKNVSKRLKAINVRKCARTWKKKVEKLKQTRNFPMLVHMSVNEHLSSWGTLSSVPSNSIFQRANDKRKCNKVITQLLLSGIPQSSSFICFDLAEMLAKNAAKTMKKGVIKPVFWKLGVSVPWTSKHTSELSIFNNLLKRWCKQSFYKGNLPLGSVQRFMTSLEIPVNISVHFSENSQSSQNLQAMNALIFVILNESESEQMCLQRLRNLVSSQVKKGDLSVAVMNIGGSNFVQILEEELEKLHTENSITHWTINSWTNNESIIESLNFLTEHLNIAPHICALPIDELVKQVSEEFFDALSSGLHLCEELIDTVKHPNRVICLYNTCLSKLEDLLMSRKLERYFNVAEEFKMYVPPMNESGGPELMCGQQCDKLYKIQVSKKINSLRLPELPNWPAKSPNCLIKMLKSYCIDVHDINIFPQIIRMLDLPDESNLQEHLKNISWLNIVEIWSQCNIRHSFSTEENFFVIFNKNEVQCMIQKLWWLKLPASISF